MRVARPRQVLRWVANVRVTTPASECSLARTCIRSKEPASDERGCAAMQVAMYDVYGALAMLVEGLHGENEADAGALKSVSRDGF